MGDLVQTEIFVTLACTRKSFSGDTCMHGIFSSRNMLSFSSLNICEFFVGRGHNGCMHEFFFFWGGGQWLCA